MFPYINPTGNEMNTMPLNVSSNLYTSMPAGVRNKNQLQSLLYRSLFRNSFLCRSCGLFWCRSLLREEHSG